MSFILEAGSGHLITASNSADPSSSCWQHSHLACGNMILGGSACDHPCFPSFFTGLLSDLPGLPCKFIHSQDFSYHLWRDLLIISSSDLSPRHMHFHFPTDHPHLSFPQALWTQHIQTESKSFLQRNLLLTILSWPMAPPCSRYKPETGNGP